MWMTKGRTILMQKDKEKKRARQQVITYYLPPFGLKITNRCNCRKKIWIFGYEFVITSRTKRMQHKI